MFKLLNASLSHLWRTARAQMQSDPGSSAIAEWARMVAGAFLISICFLVSFIAADRWLARQPTSLQSICSNMLELYKSRDEITVDEKWRQELARLNDDCAVALHKYELTSFAR